MNVRIYVGSSSSSTKVVYYQKLNSFLFINIKALFFREIEILFFPFVKITVTKSFLNLKAADILIVTTPPLSTSLTSDSRSLTMSFDSFPTIVLTFMIVPQGLATNFENNTKEIFFSFQVLHYIDELFPTFLKNIFLLHLRVELQGNKNQLFKKMALQIETTTVMRRR